MADPLTVIALAGAAVSAFGKYMGMESQSANAAYQSQVAANNARVARENAVLTAEAGETAATNIMLKTRSQVGTALATQGASGVNVNTGSSAKVRGAMGEMGVLDAMTARGEYAKRAWGYESQATGFAAESGLLKSEAEQADEMAPVAALGTLLSGASAAGGAYGKATMQGPTPEQA
jgi:hypothetical protein